MRLTTYIVSAADGLLVLGVAELPALAVTARNLHEVADAVKAEAADFTGRPVEDFEVDLPY